MDIYHGDRKELMFLLITFLRMGTLPVAEVHAADLQIEHLKNNLGYSPVQVS